VSELAETLERWRAQREEIAMATVIRVDGSAPRGEGAKMLIAGSGMIAGSVSGGCVENAVAEEARAVLASGGPKIVRYGINRNMMWDVGLACGGTIEVFVESLESGRLPNFTPGVVLCTVVRGPGRVGERLLARPSGESAWAIEGTLGDAGLDAELAGIIRTAARSAAAGTHPIGAFEVFVDPQVPHSRLVIVGAVHIAVALCEFASRAGFVVTVVDPREKLNSPERFPDAFRLAVGWPEDELPTLQFDDSTFVAVLTHDDKFDDPTLDYVMRKDVRYVGAIGSKKTQALRRQRLIDSGIPIGAIDRLHAPIGLDIGAQTPEEIAISILAEMIATRYGHRGAPLRDREAAKIHA
jgi:xanthine dehydrogenase accessory factor